MSRSLNGHWQPLRAELDGEEAPPEVLQQTELEISAGAYTVRFGGIAADTGRADLDPIEPAHLTLHGTVGPNAGRTIPCLFQFAGDELTICYGLAGTRPAAFATRPGARLYLVTYQRKTE